ncbi:MAG: hypothetical protein AAF614_25705 [Chloroflexota bacterium]
MKNKSQNRRFDSALGLARPRHIAAKATAAKPASPPLLSPLPKMRPIAALTSLPKLEIDAQTAVYHN